MVTKRLTKEEVNPHTFFYFIFTDGSNRLYLLTGIIAISTEILIFKWLYPFADYFSDSYSYIFAAASHSNVNIWPIGYSKFLWLLHQLTHSDTLLFIFQYLLLEGTAFVLFFTIRWFYNLANSTTLIIFLFLFFNPLFLYLSNYVSSDSLFTSLSLFWFIQLIWILHRPFKMQIITHGVLLTFLFTIRYNAIYYPLLTILTFLLSNHTKTAKLAGIALPVMLILIFVSFTMEKTYKETGTKQFSVFSGWQLANNALYIYPHVLVDSNNFSDSSTRLFDRIVRRYFNSVPQQVKDISPLEGAHYIRYSYSPLKQYYSYYNYKVKPSSEMAAWGNVSPIYSRWASAVIKSHPMAFGQFYLLPNATNYLVPPLEKLEVYNLGLNTVFPNAVQWFDYKNNLVRSISPSAQGWVLFLFPWLFLCLNLLFLYNLFTFIQKRTYENLDNKLKFSFLVYVSLVLLNAGFSILASPIVLRYQVFPMILLLQLAFLLPQWVATKDAANMAIANRGERMPSMAPVQIRAAESHPEQ